MLFGKKNKKPENQPQKKIEIDPDGTVFGKVTEIIEEDYEVDGQIELNTAFVDLMLDDLDITEICIALEDELDIELPTYKYKTISELVKDAFMCMNKN